MEKYKEKIVPVLLFLIIGLFALQVPFAKIIGTDAKFSLFDSFAPLSIAFLGSVPGVIAVFAMRILDALINGSQFDITMIARFFPAIFGAIYFSKKRNLNLLIPIAAIVAFNLHPVGREVWYYSLFWLIPVALHFVSDKNLFARSLAATFAQHAVGGTLWIWFVGMSAETVRALIWIVPIERLAIAAAMTILYVLFTNLLSKLQEKKNIKQFFSANIEKKYLFKKN